jgi:hypothetical protein
LGRKFRGLPMQRHRVGDIEIDHLCDDLAALGQTGGRKAMLVGEYVERRPDHETAGGAANARVHPDRGFLFHRLPARIGISLVKLAAKQGLEVRHFQRFGQVFSSERRRADSEQLHDRDDNFVDHAIEMRRDCRPSRGEERSCLVVGPLEREASFKGRN